MKKTEIPEGTQVKAYYYGRTIEVTDAIGPHEQKIKVTKGHKYTNILTGKTFAMNTSELKEQTI